MQLIKFGHAINHVKCFNYVLRDKKALALIILVSVNALSTLSLQNDHGVNKPLCVCVIHYVVDLHVNCLLRARRAFTQVTFR